MILVTPTAAAGPTHQLVSAQAPAPPPPASVPAAPAITRPLQPDRPASPGDATTPPTAGTSEFGTLSDYGIEITPPTQQRLFRIESEAQLKQRIKAETLQRPRRPDESPEVAVFPTYKPLTDDPFEPRQFGGLVKQIEPHYVNFWRLYAQQVNFERYGWSLGPVTPFVSASLAFKDFALLPYNFATRPCQRVETSAGYCYPGDPVPFLIYPPELSASGAGWEAVIIAAGFALIP
jgi:hypothetical protein